MMTWGETVEYLRARLVVSRELEARLVAQHASAGTLAAVRKQIDDYEADLAFLDDTRVRGGVPGGQKHG